MRTTLTTIAKGDCLIRLRFEVNMYTILFSFGYFRIFVNDNDTPFRNWVGFNPLGVILAQNEEYQVTPGNQYTTYDINIPDVPLNNNLNRITIEYTPTLQAITSYTIPNDKHFVLNSLFELRCTEDPGLLAITG